MRNVAKFVLAAALGGAAAYAGEAPAPAAAVEGSERFVELKLFSGLVYQGLVEKETPEELQLITPFGRLTFRKSDVIGTRTQFKDDEKASLRKSVQAADARSRRVDSPIAAEPRIEIPIARAIERANTDDFRPRVGVRSLSWQDRMTVGLNKKISVELVGESLNDTVSLLSSLTGLTIIVAPEVQKLNPPLNLKVQEMDAGTFIRWITQLTSTHAEVKDQAIFITDKPSKEEQNAEREYIAMLAQRLGADVNLPPEGQELTNEERVRIALELAKKENPKPQDFPGPDIGIGVREASSNPFEVPR